MQKYVEGTHHVETAGPSSTVFPVDGPSFEMPTMQGSLAQEESQQDVDVRDLIGSAETLVPESYSQQSTLEPVNSEMVS